MVSGDNVTPGASSMVRKMLSESYQKRQKKLRDQIDGRLRSRIEQKKAAHGLKTDHSDQDEDQGFGMTM